MQIELEQDEDISVQMAPLIDCVFLLLIFFLVATTLKKVEKELPLEPPKAATAVSKRVTDDMVIVSVDRQGNLYLGSDPVGQGFLWNKLRELAGQNPGRHVRIDADRDTPTYAVVQVLDMCHFEGLSNVGIKTKKTEQDVELP